MNNMKKWLGVAAAGVFLWVAPTAEAKTFQDVPMYEQEVEYLVESSVIQGYADGTFRPNEQLTRLQAITMLLNTLPPVEVTQRYRYSDVTLGTYGYHEVMQATELQIVSGKNDGTFDRFGFVTRAQMAKMLVEAYRLQLKPEAVKSFTDVTDEAWYAPYVAILTSNGVTTGYADGTFKPNEPISRLHFAVMLSRHLQQHGPGEPQNPNDGSSPVIDRPVDQTPVVPR